MRVSLLLIFLIPLNLVAQHLKKYNWPDSLVNGEQIALIAGRLYADDPKLQLFIQHGDAVNKLMNDDKYAENTVDEVIAREIIDPLLRDQPDWEVVFNAVQKRFGSRYAQRNVMDARIRWYYDHQQWPAYVRQLVDRVKSYGPFVAIDGKLLRGSFLQDYKWNSNAWDLFEKSSDTALLSLGLTWSLKSMSLARDPNASYYDTYANLLYKLGRQQEAIEWETKAVKMMPAVKEYRETLLKMQQNAPTSPTSKPVIDSSTFGRWPDLRGAAISANGKFAMHAIAGVPLNNSTLVIYNVENGWKLNIVASVIGRFYFTNNNRLAIFLVGPDSLGIVDLANKQTSYYRGIKSFRLAPLCSEWLVYETVEKQTIIRQLSGNKEITFNHTQRYLLSDDGETVYLVQADAEKYQVLCYSTLRNEQRVIWKGGEVFDLKLSVSAKAIAFIAEANNVRGMYAYCAGDAQARILFTEQSDILVRRFDIAKLEGFSADDDRLYFRLRELEAPAPVNPSTSVDVWHYRDMRLQSQQLDELSPRDYLFVWEFRNGIIMRIEQSNEQAQLPFPMKKGSDSYILVTRRDGEYGESNWNPSAEGTTYLVRVEDGARQQVGNEKNHCILYSVSPTGRYVTYYDMVQHHIYCYDTRLKKSSILTLHLSRDSISEKNLSIINEPLFEIATWMEGDERLIMYDHFDIWELDPAGKQRPNNITNGYGNSNHIIFHLVIEPEAKRFISGEHIVVSGFNINTKQNGFFRVEIGTHKDPQPLTMEPCIYSVYDQPGVVAFTPMKARDTEAYIVRRESVREFPHYLFTKDFKSFISLGDYTPEKRYNWYNSKLYSWDDGSGRMLQGVLYTPEDIDSTKRYPLIFHYYEQMSQLLNVYQLPEASDSRINIPYFVSNGYLIFTPDIHYTKGHTGESALSSILSAAKMLRSITYVDSARMGLQGHSFGGFETNYIVTHSNIFAAACTAAGVCDLISDYGLVWQKPAVSKKPYYELSQGRMGMTLWDNKEAYLENSPVFEADRVSTPLLLMHNKKDGAVPFEQGLAFFTALRRLGKRAWLLQYDDGDHTLNGKSALDFTIRMQQFFDHYLKGEPAPVWMTRGIPAKQKGMITGLDYDTEIKTPGPGLLKENP